MDFVTMKHVKKIVESDPEKYRIGTIKVTGSICEWEIIQTHPSVNERGHVWVTDKYIESVAKKMVNNCTNLALDTVRNKKLNEVTRPKLKPAKHVDMYSCSCWIYYVQKTGENDKGDIHIKLEE